MLTREQLFDRELTASSAAALRTLTEQSRLTIGLPAVKELPWLKPTETPSGATVITDPDHDYIPAGQSFVRSDTGELLHNWKFGIQTISAPKTQAVNGWVGGKTLQTTDAVFRIATPKAVVALTSLDDQPLAGSHNILVTAMGRAIPVAPNRLPFLTEPIDGIVLLRTKVRGFELLAMHSDGTIRERQKLQESPEGVTIKLPSPRGTHWYVLKSSGGAPE
jgi:hypothetical protein